jgi:hypothetical protein
MQETLATMMTSRRSKSDRVAESRIRSISSLIVASFSMYESVAGTLSHPVADDAQVEVSPETPRVAFHGLTKLAFGVDHPAFIQQGSS